MSNFNNEQNKAINSTGNVIVSAGAGSGKTTVLTERVRRNILGEEREKVKLDELLILTFTNDAATSMKNKIKEALEKNLSLAHLVPLVDSAHIETIDAYQKFIVSKYGQEFGYPKSINVLPEDILLVKAVEVLNNIFEELYESENQIFKEIIFDYCVKNDNKFFDFILSIYKNNLAKVQRKHEFLENYKNNYVTKNYFENLILETENTIKKDISLLSEEVNHLINRDLKTYYQELFADLKGVDSFSDLIALKDILKSEDRKKVNDIINGIDDEFIKNEENRNRERIRKIYETLKNLSTFDLDTFLKIDIDKQVKFLTFIIDEILIKLVDRCEQFKFESGYFTFSDISNIAIDILEKSESIRNELKYQYKLIMVDECQDNSSEQNYFIDLISNNNVFSVGDIKQSIYKFRKAAPELFQEKYDKYKENNGGQAIDMNTNYRSRSEILDAINEMFIKLMTNDFGGANYKKDHIILAGNKTYNKVPQNCLNHGVFMIDNAIKYSISYPKDSYNKEDKYNGEANAIALDILAKIFRGYEVIDRDENGKSISRKAEFKDFAVLTYNANAFQIYENVFAALGIPVKVIYTDNIKTDLTIILMARIFKLLYLLNLENRSKVEEGEIKHCLISILRSYVSNVTDEQIYNLFKSKIDNYKNSIIYKKYAEFAELCKNLPLSEVYIKILHNENFLDNVSSLRNAIVAIDKNNMLYEKTKIMDELGYDLKDLSEYFERLDSYKIEVEQEVFSESENAVTLTTIHKSKGLEYPCVYLPSLFDFRGSKTKNNGDYYVLNNRFFLPFFADPTKTANLIGYCLKEDDEFERVFDEERLRLFYVALTRAKEDLIFVYSEEQAKSYEEVYKIYKDNLLKELEETKVQLSEEEIEKEIIARIKWREKGCRGKDFLEFLNKSYSHFDVSPYLDSDLINFDKIFNSYLEENEIELTNEEKAEINFNFVQYVINSHLETFEINVNEFIRSQLDELSKNKLNKIKEERILYNAFYKYKDKVLEKITIDPNGEGGGKQLELYFDDGAKYLTGTLNESSYSKCLKYIAYNQIDELIKYTDIFGDKEEDLSAFEDDEESANFSVDLREINIERKVNLRSKKASKDVDDQVDESALHFGTHVHALLESIDFKNPNYSLIKDNKEKVERVVNLLNRYFDLKNLEIFKEYQFEDLINGTKGVIDLLLIGDNHAYIIDYKLKNIDDDKYNYQLKVYKDYVKSVFKVDEIKTYLLSILNSKIEEREV